jgi:hypothetical protein
MMQQNSAAISRLQNIEGFRLTVDESNMGEANEEQLVVLNMRKQAL